MYDPPAVRPPADAYTRQRFIRERFVDWARECHRVMLEHGAVHGDETYEHRHQARWRAQRLIRVMVELRLHPRWELSEHTERQGDRWAWAVEYTGARDTPAG